VYQGHIRGLICSAELLFQSSWQRAEECHGEVFDDIEEVVGVDGVP
jgi:hypothetical protein